MGNMLFSSGMQIGGLSEGSTLTMTSGATGVATINGRTYRGRKISMLNGQVVVDGKTVNDDEPGLVAGQKVVYRTCVIEVKGPMQGNISTSSGTVTVHGTVTGSVKTMSGSVHIEGGDVQGHASTMSGSIDIEGDCGGQASSMSGNVRINKQSRKRVRVEEVVPEERNPKRLKHKE